MRAWDRSNSDASPEDRAHTKKHRARAISTLLILLLRRADVAVYLPDGNDTSTNERMKQLEVKLAETLLATKKNT